MKLFYHEIEVTVQCKHFVVIVVTCCLVSVWLYFWLVKNSTCHKVHLFLDLNFLPFSLDFFQTLYSWQLILAFQSILKNCERNFTTKRNLFLCMSKQGYFAKFNVLVKCLIASSIIVANLTKSALFRTSFSAIKIVHNMHNFLTTFQI